MLSKSIVNRHVTILAFMNVVLATFIYYLSKQSKVCSKVVFGGNDIVNHWLRMLTNVVHIFICAMVTDEFISVLCCSIYILGKCTDHSSTLG